MTIKTDKYNSYIKFLYLLSILCFFTTLDVISSNLIAYDNIKNSQKCTNNESEKYLNYILELKSLSADFIQHDHNDMNGKIVMKSPNKMKIEYLNPNHLLILANNNKITMYDFLLKETSFIDDPFKISSIIGNKKVKEKFFIDCIKLSEFYSKQLPDVKEKSLKVNDNFKNSLIKDKSYNSNLNDKNSIIEEKTNHSEEISLKFKLKNQLNKDSLHLAEVNGMIIVIQNNSSYTTINNSKLDNLTVKKFITINANDQIVSEIFLKNIQINREIDDKIFIFKDPNLISNDEW
ncbi:outer-membrane lipoprotein carrier protein LolA [Lyticum sinuosum]|uniref:LolA-like domain protein n=1 Tax=Lyticum sinuosum TaxID=1332059 RepID=A0AAE5AGV9_9RICK|nr:outer-membrane lipoprotein carrier protein LolA [Lyticum sinuosum]MDZ5761267.1 putative LolA-like domain protein [Lyticum sinuosum]